VKRIIMVVALVLIMAAVAAPAALARQNSYCYQISSGELVVFTCQPSKKACEQAQANDPRALSACMKESKIFG
jgi:hypothetical protein